MRSSVDVQAWFTYQPENKYKSTRYKSDVHKSEHRAFFPACPGFLPVGGMRTVLMAKSKTSFNPF